MVHLQEQTNGGGKLLKPKAERNVEEVPDLIDTGVAYDFLAPSSTDESSVNTVNLGAPLVDDIFGDGFSTNCGSSRNKKEDDPFADVSFHPPSDSEQNDHLFSGLNVDGALGNSDNVADPFLNFSIDGEQNVSAPKDSFSFKSEVFGLSDSQFGTLQSSTESKGLNDLVASLSSNVSTPLQKHGGDQKDDPLGPLTTELLSNMVNSGRLPSNILNSNTSFPLGSYGQHNNSPNFVFNPAAFSPNYSAMNSVIAQQQLFAAMSNHQHLGHVTAVPAANPGHEGSSFPLPDIFHYTYSSAQTASSMPTNMKREETRAFDFVSV